MFSVFSTIVYAPHELLVYTAIPSHYCRVIENIIFATRFYTSGVIAQMLKQGLPFKAIPIPRESIEVVGVPRQVEEFCKRRRVKPQRFVFQVEETLLAEGLDAAPNARMLRYVEGCVSTDHIKTQIVSVQLSQ